MITLFVAVTLANGKAGAKGAFCLYDSTDIYIKSNLTAVAEFHRTFQITSEAGEHYAETVIPVNDYIEVKDIKGFTLLPGGARVPLNKKDIVISSTAGFRGFGGIRVVTFALRSPTVGSQLHYQYRQVIKSLLYLPRITRNTCFPSDRLVVILRWDKEVVPRYNAYGVDILPQGRSVKFIATDLPELPDEIDSCPDKLFILISTEAFSYDKMKYRSRTWIDIGRFYAQLSEPQETGSGELKSLAAGLCRTSPTRLDTLNAFFDFLADSVSYVALQMGKGDFDPHAASLVIDRRFGDCKDQSVLLSALCREVGFDAYPALIFTGEYPRVDSLAPWPSWFDHVATVIKEPSGDLLLDPSDPLASVRSSPPRLRGKSYLVCDGFSGLKSTPEQPAPAFGITWQFNLLQPFDDTVKVGFSVKYANDASALYQDLWEGKSLPELATLVESIIKRSGWNVISLDVDPVLFLPDSLIVSGRFSVRAIDIGDSHGLAIASPVLSFLLDNLFPDIRKSDYCRSGSVRLEETVAVDLVTSGIITASRYDESWKRDGIEFLDELTNENGEAIFHRLYYFTGDIVTASDYNAFRDFILSRRGQQYVRFEK